MEDKKESTVRTVTENEGQLAQAVKTGSAMDAAAKKTKARADAARVEIRSLSESRFEPGENCIRIEAGNTSATVTKSESIEPTEDPEILTRARSAISGGQVAAFLVDETVVRIPGHRSDEVTQALVAAGIQGAEVENSTRIDRDVYNELVKGEEVDDDIARKVKRCVTAKSATPRVAFAGSEAPEDLEDAVLASAETGQSIVATAQPQG